MPSSLSLPLLTSRSSLYRYTQSQVQFNAYVQAETLLNNYAHILDLLTRLRQAIDHPYLVLHSKRGEEAAADGAGIAGGAQYGDGGAICGLCFEDAEAPVTARCGHVFCRECVSSYLETIAADAACLCPTCRATLSVDLGGSSGGGESSAATARGGGGGGYSRKGILSRIELSKFQSSTKIEALMEALHEMKQEDPAAKAIVFSQFVSMLELLEYRLQRAGTKAVKLSGGMGVAQRDAVLTAFKEDPDVSVILISLKAGGVALNLTVASHIFLMDPWWNPAAEYQAIDRAHRIGQHKPIKAVRFIIRNTVEERILRLQDKKRLVFEGTVGGDAASLAQLSEDDLRFLFQN